MRVTLNIIQIPGTNDYRLSTKVSRVSDAGEAGFEDDPENARNVVRQSSPLLAKIAAVRLVGLALATGLVVVERLTYQIVFWLRSLGKPQVNEMGRTGDTYCKQIMLAATGATR